MTDPLQAAISAAQQDSIAANMARWIAFRGIAAGEWIELQVIDVPEGRYRSSKFAHASTAEDAARLLAEADRWKAPGVYQIANHVDPAVATRAAPGRWHVAEKGGSTSDREILSRRVLFIDLDARRPKGTSATDSQVASTHAVAVALHARLSELGAAASLAVGHSGNGRSLFLALDDLPETAEISAIVKGILAAAKEGFETAAVEIDLAVSDAKRLIPAWGTVKRKGAEGFSERPHRRTAFTGPADPHRLGQDELERLLAGLLATLGAEASARVERAMGMRLGVSAAAPPPAPRKTPRQGPDLFAFANEALEIRDVLAWLSLLDGDAPVCPGCGLSGDSSVAIVGNGVKCLHARCADRGHPGRPGFRGVVDVVMEARNIDAKGALAALRERWPERFPTVAPARQVVAATVAPTAPPPSPTDAPAAPPPPPDTPLQRGDHVELASRLLASLGTEPLTHDDGQFWRYASAEGAWSLLPVPVVEQGVASMAGHAIATSGGRTKALLVSASTVRGTVAVAQSRLLAQPDRRTFAEAPSGIAFRNGFVTVVAGAIALLPHAPEHMARASLPFDYDPHARRDDLIAFFEEVFADCSEEERACRVALIQQFAGACLIGDAPRYQKCLVIFGVGGNGKGELLRILRGMFPPGSVVSLPPQQWGQRFQLARLVGVRANFCDEIPERDITSGDVFKSVITGDPIHAERKNEAPFEFRPSAGHIFSANVLPGTVDQSDGFWRRFAVVPFTRRFDASPTRRLDAGALVLASCLPGLLAWALEGAADAQRQGGYTVSEASRAAVEAWREETDPVRLFLRERVDSSVPAGAFYDAYVSWARANGHMTMSSNRFGRRVTSTGLYTRLHTRGGDVYTRVSA